MEWRDLHEAVVQAHHSDNQAIHAEGKDDHSFIEPDQAVVLDQSLVYKSGLHTPNEVIVQRTVYHQVDAFLASIPNFVDVDISLRYLEASGDP